MAHFYTGLRVIFAFKTFQNQSLWLGFSHNAPRREAYIIFFLEWRVHHESLSRMSEVFCSGAVSIHKTYDLFVSVSWWPFHTALWSVDCWVPIARKETARGLRGESQPQSYCAFVKNPSYTEKNHHHTEHALSNHSSSMQIRGLVLSLPDQTQPYVYLFVLALVFRLKWRTHPIFRHCPPEVYVASLAAAHVMVLQVDTQVSKTFHGCEWSCRLQKFVLKIQLSSVSACIWEDCKITYLAQNAHSLVNYNSIPAANYISYSE